MTRPPYAEVLARAVDAEARLITLGERTHYVCRARDFMVQTAIRARARADALAEALVAIQHAATTGDTPRQEVAAWASEVLTRYPSSRDRGRHAMVREDKIDELEGDLIEMEAAIDLMVDALMDAATSRDCRVALRAGACLLDPRVQAWISDETSERIAADVKVAT